MGPFRKIKFLLCIAVIAIHWNPNDSVKPKTNTNAATGSVPNLPSRLLPYNPTAGTQNPPSNVPKGTNVVQSLNTVRDVKNTQQPQNQMQLALSQIRNQGSTSKGTPQTQDTIKTTHTDAVPTPPGPRLGPLLNPTSSSTTIEDTATVSNEDNEAHPSNKRKFCRNEKDPRKCHVYINELLPSKRTVNGFTEKQFVEIVCKCRRSASLNGKDTLEGYLLLVVDIKRTNENPNFHGNIVFFADVMQKKMSTRADEPKTDGTTYYFTTGTLDASDMKITRKQNPVQHLSGQLPIPINAIPAEDNFPKLVILLNIPAKQRTKTTIGRFQLHLSPVNHFAASQRSIDGELASLITQYKTDVFVYGRECSEKDATLIRKLFPEFPKDCSDYIMSIEDGNRPATVTVGYSKCKDDLPYQINTFEIATITPGNANECKPPKTETDVTPVLPLFKLERQHLHSQCQKIVLNLWWSIRKGRKRKDFFDGEPLEVAAKLAGLSNYQIKKANKRYRENIITTPGKKRKPSACCMMVKLDPFDLDKIRGYLQNGYAGGTSLTSTQLRAQFLEFKDSQYEELKAKKATNPAIELPKKFTCSLKTFRRVLRFIGFRFRTIDQRAKLIQRPDLVGWRGRYLRKLMKNRRRDPPKKLVYLDETWVDPHLRVSKGWVPAAPYLKKDLALYTYATVKIGRGPRLIVLSAVTEDGIIKESISVTKVSKAQNELEDYHKNINSERFLAWFKVLLDALDKRKRENNEDFLIIMDNASYHSSRLYPKKSDTKKAVYDWLKSHEGKEGLDLFVPPFKDVRKWELEMLVEQVVTNPIMESELYSIDKLAADRNFEVVRLAPYHCHLSPIELVWKDVKYNASKYNTRQNVNLVKERVEYELENYDIKYVKAHFGHVRRLEDETWKADGWFEEQEGREPDIVQTENDSDNTDDEDTHQNPSEDDMRFDFDSDEDYLEWVNDILEVELSESDEMYESDGTLWLQEECDQPNEEYDIENDIARYMNTNPKRYRSDPFMIARRLNFDN